MSCCSCRCWSLSSIPLPPQQVQSKIKFSIAIPKHEKLLGSAATCSLKTLSFNLNKFGLLCGAALASMEMPAMAVTGSNYEVDLKTVLIQGGITAVLYFFVAPPIIMNWMRLRWYKRKFVEMYFQFMCVFIFFPGLMLWAPFLNFRKFPRDPTMKYPWSKAKKDTPLYKSR